MLDEAMKDSVLDGLTGELDDYSAEKVGLKPKGVSITISVDKGEEDDLDPVTPLPGECTGCSMHCGGLVEK